ncbi:glycosyltransferase family 4 protein [Rudanella lutea]|uniref:glycosyltransferase family 4 protein n=1 Tax=Rudanella lutea TaxID=451374 RepID=UPI00035DB7E2|nr:glycosyltransferase family 1 protein [Rudanella lutea]
MSSDKKVRICADVRMINNSGIGVYIHNYIKNLISNDRFSVTLIGQYSECIAHFGKHKKWDHIEASFPIYSIKEQISLPKLIPSCDVFWSPHYNIPLGPIKARKRLVTVPDVYHLAHMDSLTAAQKVYAKIMTNAAVHLSDQIITISNFSKKEISKHTGIRLDKIITIPLGIDTSLYNATYGANRKNEIAVKYNTPTDYILFVGNVKPNKNLKALVDILPQLNHQFPELDLLIVGKKEGFIMKDSSLFLALEQNENIRKKVHFTGYVDTKDLPVIYSMASLFAFPSLYEGFGFPPLEAMACGCPVVASDRASIPEICGDAVIYFDPLNSDSITKSIVTVLSDPALKSEMIYKGIKKVKEYNWVESQACFEDIIYRLA